jgi:hypothetical protein
MQSSKPSIDPAGNGRLSEKDARRKLELPLIARRLSAPPNEQSDNRLKSRGRLARRPSYHVESVGRSHSHVAQMGATIPSLHSRTCAYYAAPSRSCVHVQQRPVIHTRPTCSRRPQCRTGNLADLFALRPAAKAPRPALAPVCRDGSPAPLRFGTFRPTQRYYARAIEISGTDHPMPKPRWPTYSEWGVVIAIVVAIACIGFGVLVTYNGMERARQNLEVASQHTRL